MDSTHLFKTGYTAEQTQLYRPSLTLDQSYLSQQPTRNIQSRILSPRAQQSMFHSTQPQFIPRQIPQNQTIPQLNSFIHPQNLQRVQSTPIIQPTSYRVPQQISVYCPVCKKQYTNSQVQYHARIHDAAYQYDFNVINKSDSKDLQRTQEILLDGSQLTTASSNAVQYPLVQPLQFWTNQLNDSSKHDVFIYKQHKNYDSVDRTLFASKPSYRQAQTQTHQRPPLQYQSNDTNLYNCLDNVVNSKNGPKFSMNDIFKNNKIITPKRQLQDWEIIQKNQIESNTFNKTNFMRRNL